MFNSNRDWKLYLKDIKNECENIKNFTKNVTFEEFSNNLEKIYATLKSFENIGEAVKNLPKEITLKYPKVEWKNIAGMRDIITHHYFGVDDNTIWQTIQNRLPTFENTIDEMLSIYTKDKKGEN